MKATGNKPRLQQIFLVGILAVALVPALVMSLQGYHCAMEGIIALKKEHLLSTARSKAELLEDWLAERERDFAVSCMISCGVDGCSGLHSHVEAEHIHTLKSPLFGFELDEPFYESLMVFDAEFHPIADTTSSSHHADEFMTPAFKKRLIEATGMILDGTHHHETGRPGLHMGYTVRQNPGAPPSGYIVANAALDTTLDRLLDPTGLGDRAAIYLLSKEGRYLTLPPRLQPDRLGKPSKFGPLPTPELEEIVSEYEDDQHVFHLVGVRYIPRTSWYLVVEVDRSEALNWLAILKQRALVTALLSLIALVFIASYAARTLSRPFHQLADTAHRITEGHREVRVHEMRIEEAEEVGQAFNQMLNALDQAQQEIVNGASLAAMGQLSSSIVHEIRNPLSTINLNLRALNRRAQGDPALEELGQIAVDEVERVETMLSELLEFSKPLDLQRMAITFDELFEPVKQHLSPHATQHQVRIHWQNALGNRRLHVDPKHARRLMENLLINAVAMMPGGGEIQVDVQLNEHFAMCHVQDTGPGIPGNLLQTLFDPFVTYREGGTGLGLANAKKIVELHGGSIHAGNLPDRGAIFTFTLPLEKDIS